MDETSARSLALHERMGGKIEVQSRKAIETNDDLALLYTPGVAEPCRQIQADYQRSWDLTRRSNLVAVITDGTAVLGLGDIGPAAGMPVMEGKCALFKEFGDVDAFPLCVDTHDVDEFVRTVQLISKSFGGINLEDIAAPRCFEIERRLQDLCDIPVFHDDQRGTAIVVAAALENALRLTGAPKGSLRIAMSGAGAAGIAIAERCSPTWASATSCSATARASSARATVASPPPRPRPRASPTPTTSAARSPMPCAGPTSSSASPAPGS